MDYNPPGSSVYGISQAKLLEWVTISFSMGSSQPRDQALVSHIAGRFFTIWATGEGQWEQVLDQILSNIWIFTKQTKKPNIW